MRVQQVSQQPAIPYEQSICDTNVLHADDCGCDECGLACRKVQGLRLQVMLNVQTTFFISLFP